MSNKYFYKILLKEEIENIIKLFKNKKSYACIGKELNRSPINIKNEINKYIKKQYENGSSIYKLSKEYDFTLENIKKIIDTTKISEIDYLEKHKFDTIIDLLKTKHKYTDIATKLDTSNETIILYIKRIVKENLDNGLTKDKIIQIYNIKINQINKFFDTPIATKKLSKLEILKIENENLKKEIISLKQLLKCQ